jgi:hypothetical protein
VTPERRALRAAATRIALAAAQGLEAAGGPEAEALAAVDWQTEQTLEIVDLPDGLLAFRIGGLTLCVMRRADLLGIAADLAAGLH